MFNNNDEIRLLTMMSQKYDDREKEFDYSLMIFAMSLVEVFKED